MMTKGCELDQVGESTQRPCPKTGISDLLALSVEGIAIKMDHDS